MLSALCERSSFDSTHPGFFLLAMISLSLFPIIKKELAHLPNLQEKLISGLLTPLAIADVSILDSNRWPEH
jgi:hypothetical protein